MGASGRPATIGGLNSPVSAGVGFRTAAPAPSAPPRPNRSQPSGFELPPANWLGSILGPLVKLLVQPFSVDVPPVNGPTDLLLGMVEFCGGMISGPVVAGGPPPVVFRVTPGGGGVEPAGGPAPPPTGGVR